MSKKVGNYTYSLSKDKTHKLSVVVENRTINFGNKNYSHYFDKTGLLPKNLNHLDPKRRENYLTRSAGIRNGKGQLTKDDPTSKNFHARKILW
jgi:hypothetical protein